VEHLDCAVFIHPWDMSSNPREQVHWFPWLLGMPHETGVAMASILMGGVLERHPKLRICFAHGGGCFPALVGRISHGFHARADLCQNKCHQDPKEFLHQLYVDSLVHDPEILRLLVSKFGPHRVMLGTDYPFPLGEISNPGSLIEKTITDENVRNHLLYRTALEFLRLES